METLQIKLVNTVGLFSTKLFKMEHNIEKAEKIPVDKKTIVSVDYEKYRDGVIWDHFADLDIGLRNKLKELRYYSKIHLSLNDILNKFDHLNYMGRYEIRSLGHQAFKIINEMAEPQNFAELRFCKSLVLGRIGHTINKEVDALMSLEASSQSVKDNLLKDAIIHLKSNIQPFVDELENFEV